MLDLPFMDRMPRLERVRAAMAEADLGALLVTDLANIRYLTGFTGSAAKVVLTDDQLFFVTDGRYGVQSVGQLGEARLDATFTVGNLTEQMEALTKLVAGHRLGFEAGTVTVAQANQFAAAFEPELTATTGLVELVRRCKDTGEVARIKAASRIAADALHDVLDRLEPTMTELDIAIEIESFMRRAGASGPSFDTIVASGQRAALPHARPERVEIGDQPVVIDWGAIVDGYCSDTTRTVAVGTVEAEVVDTWHAVLASQQAGLGRVEAGAPLADVDLACRESLATVGLDGYFTTGTGHGVGLQIHEDPFIGRTSTGNIELGDIITVEPGVYIPGRFGIRIEDFYYVTANGPERLSPARLSPLLVPR
jgi:Xaa-Pro aminopeptidase